MFGPENLEEAKRWRYNWDGCDPYDPKFCATVVDVPGGTWLDSKQCGRKPGHGPDKIFCKQQRR